MIIHEYLNLRNINNPNLAHHKIKQKHQCRFHQENLLLLPIASEGINSKICFQNGIENQNNINKLNSSPKKEFSNQKADAYLNEISDS